MSHKRKPVSLARHRRICSICSHAQCAEIESAFVSWSSPTVIAKEYGLADRATIYRHAHACSLFDTRRANVRAALERIIEKASEVEVTASAIVSAVQVYSKINASGRWIEPSEQVNMRDLYERMTVQEMDAYARTGQLPEWFRSITPNV